jgi:hypothetical protein
MMLAGTIRPPARPMLSRRDRDGGGDMRGAIVDARLGVAISRPARKDHGSACMVRGLRRIARSLPVDGGVLACPPHGACRHSACADKSLAISLRKCWMLRLLRPSRTSIQACPCARWSLRTGLWPCSGDQPAGVVMLAGYRLDAHVTTCAGRSSAVSCAHPVEPEPLHASQRTQTRTCDAC